VGRVPEGDNVYVAPFRVGGIGGEVQRIEKRRGSSRSRS
jgi:hypothetical protein